MSLVHSARLSWHDPHAYLKDVLERCPRSPPAASRSCCRTAGSPPSSQA